MSRTKTINVDVEVDVDLAEWTTEELEEELRRRQAPSPSRLRGIYETLYYALARREIDRVMTVAGELVEAKTGRVVP